MTGAAIYRLVLMNVLTNGGKSSTCTNHTKNLTRSQQKWTAKSWYIVTKCQGLLKVLVYVAEFLFITLPFLMHTALKCVLYFVVNVLRVVNIVIWVRKNMLQKVGLLNRCGRIEGWAESAGAYKFAIKVGFSWMFATGAAIYAVFLWNTLFYLLFSAKTGDFDENMCWKLWIMVATAYNLAPGMNIFIYLTVDSWSGFSKMFLEVVKEHTDFTHWVNSGQFANVVGTKNTTLVHLFGDLDVDGDGSVSREELYLAVQNGMPNLDSFDIHKKFDEMDSDNDGDVGFAEFKKWASTWPQLSMLQERVEAASSVHRVERTVTNAFYRVACFIGLFTVFLVFLGKYQGLGTAASEFDDPNELMFVNITNECNGKAWNERVEAGNAIEEDGYALCDEKWHGLSVFDYSLLASLAYVTRGQGASIEKATDCLFPLELYGSVNLRDDSALMAELKENGDVFNKFHTFEFQKQKLRVVAVSGTNPVDIVRDMYFLYACSRSLKCLAAAPIFQSPPGSE